MRTLIGGLVYTLAAIAFMLALVGAAWYAEREKYLTDNAVLRDVNLAMQQENQPMWQCYMLDKPLRTEKQMRKFLGNIK